MMPEAKNTPMATKKIPAIFIPDTDSFKNKIPPSIASIGVNAPKAPISDAPISRTP